MVNQNVDCVLAENATPIQKHKWKKYSIPVSFPVDGELIKKEWEVFAANVFAADKWANLMIESEAGTLVKAKKRIEKIK